MSEKYHAINVGNSLKDIILIIFKTFPEYPNWAVFKGSDGLDYTLPFSNVEKVEDEE